MPRTTDRPPWCGLGETPEAAAARILAIARQHTTHGETADALGVSWRTVARWWAWMREHAPDVELPPRTGGTPAQAARARDGRAAKRGAHGMTGKS